MSSLSYTYGSQGNFICSKNSKLFDGNGIYKSVSRTICNKYAQWKNLTSLRCLKGWFFAMLLIKKILCYNNSIKSKQCDIVSHENNLMLLEGCILTFCILLKRNFIGLFGCPSLCLPVLTPPKILGIKA